MHSKPNSRVLVIVWCFRKGAKDDGSNGGAAACTQLNWSAFGVWKVWLWVWSSLRADGMVGINGVEALSCLFLQVQWRTSAQHACSHVWSTFQRIGVVVGLYWLWSGKEGGGWVRHQSLGTHVGQSGCNFVSNRWCRAGRSNYPIGFPNFSLHLFGAPASIAKASKGCCLVSSASSNVLLLNQVTFVCLLL